MSYYDALGVPKNADAATIKRAYRRKSREHHPDRPSGDHKAMVAVNRAFEMLSDPERRARYDQCGEDRPAAPPLDTLARNIVMQIIMQLLERTGDQDDIIRLTCETIRGNQGQMRSSAEQAKRKIEKLETRRKRVKYRGKQGNFIDDLLGQQITMLEGNIAKADEQIKVGDRACELLQDFEYEIEKVVTPATADDMEMLLKLFRPLGSK